MAEPATVIAEDPVVSHPRRHRGGGGTLGRYLIIRALLIIPTVLILVTTVFVLSGSPATRSPHRWVVGSPRSSWPNGSTKRATTGR